MLMKFPLNSGNVKEKQKQYYFVKSGRSSQIMDNQKVYFKTHYFLLNLAV